MAEAPEVERPQVGGPADLHVPAGGEDQARLERAAGQGMPVAGDVPQVGLCQGGHDAVPGRHVRHVRHVRSVRSVHDGRDALGGVGGLT